MDNNSDHDTDNMTLHDHAHIQQDVQCWHEFSKAGKGSPTHLSQIQAVPIAVIIGNYVSVGECGGRGEGGGGGSSSLYPFISLPMLWTLYESSQTQLV